ncbi:MAG: ACT domain-containing protein, partial [Peptostreptococcaceae bacterium]
RIEPEAKVLNYIGYEEVFEMADKGAKVIHPRAVQLAKSGNITLAIKNTLNPTYEGTKIGLESKNNNSFKYEDDKGVMTAVAHKDKICQVKIKSTESVFTEILNKIEENKISIDMINFFIGEKAFVIDECDCSKLEEMLKACNVEYEINSDCAKVTLIGSKITGTPGVMAKIVRVLSKEGISLIQTSDSSMTIACLVSRENMSKAVHAIHHEFYVE